MCSIDNTWAHRVNHTSPRILSEDCETKTIVHPLRGTLATGTTIPTQDRGVSAQHPCVQVLVYARRRVAAPNAHLPHCKHGAQPSQHRTRVMLHVRLRSAPTKARGSSQPPPGNTSPHIAHVPMCRVWGGPDPCQRQLQRSTHATRRWRFVRGGLSGKASAGCVNTVHVVHAQCMRTVQLPRSAAADAPLLPRLSQQHSAAAPPLRAVRTAGFTAQRDGAHAARRRSAAAPNAVHTPDMHIFTYVQAGPKRAIRAPRAPAPRPLEKAEGARVRGPCARRRTTAKGAAHARGAATVTRR
eukprot:TRINITY_DN13230_c0_g1_i1.p1 TRINITY_DN13230_c0_g1~~TRINITY_DN13230_c0_g1_i1.p1  ORF type:complete len:298 (-),score=23.98 TRINITY_DN13230_c0_g1_i1:89-982(-)